MVIKLSAAALLCASFACAGTVVYTSSAAFEAATSIAQTEDYGTATAGTDLAPGDTLDGLTYGNFVLLNGDTNLDIVDNTFNSFSGMSLGADHIASSGIPYFLGTEGATITFANPVNAFGMFFNVNLNSGTYGFTTPVGSAFTDSTAYDTSTFVFAGLISDTPFSSVSFTSTDPSLGVYNVTELLVGPAATTAATPEPSTILMMASGTLLLAIFARKQRRA